ncbi:restriction endonuclease [Nostocaceae cyanobacterium CENA369]|uniref:Restriction endonuclease n=1 Tax=Dendronalium phyllosphericum CENA369 TaxID=1725256 RepID=A0A8J7I828_9NOST|nr:restriction endonuclease [Dendronalium phyllosphericum]MBH8575943.1 restriction endonuclease [Dendronalium phyllosphericum CENA369]
MQENQPSAKKYEYYTRQILNDNRIRKYLEKYFNLYELRIKPEEQLLGKKTKTKWKVDAYGHDINNHLIVIECKHYKNNIKQSLMGAFAYTLQDLNAKGGIFITSTGFQAGAIKIAKTEKINLLKIDYNSTDTDFVVHFSSNKTQPSHAIAAFTDQLNGVSGMDGKMVVTQYPLDEAQKQLQQRTGRTQFSSDEINEEIANILKEV